MSYDECPCGATSKSSIKLEFETIKNNLIILQTLILRLEFTLREIVDTMGKL